MKKQYRSSIIKRKYRCRKEDMDHVIRKSKEVSGKQRLPELEGVCNAQGWVDVCKTPEG